MPSIHRTWWPLMLPRDLAGWLAQIEALRPPITSRAVLPTLLETIAHALVTLLPAPGITISTCAEAFVPPLPVLVQIGIPIAAPTDQLLIWGTTTLGRVTIDAADAVLLADHALLLRVAADALAEVWVAEAQLRQRELATRRALAADLHDTTKQIFAAIRLFAERAEREVTRDPTSAQALLRDIQSTAQEGLDELLFVISELRGQSAADDLNGALDRLRTQVQIARPALQIVWDVTLPPLAHPQATCLLATLRNALSNVIQHAEARTVAVIIRAEPGTIQLIVQDDGIGVSPAIALAAPGIGMESVRERVTRLGGALTIRSAPGAGLYFAVSLPLEEVYHG